MAVGLGLAGADETPRGFTDEEIKQAFSTAHQGFSSDELLIRDDLRIQFLSQLGIGVDEASSGATERAALHELLRLRKTGRLNVPTTQRSGTPLLEDPMIAEIAIRTVTDRHRISSDEVLCDPQLRAELQREAERVQGNIDAASLRKTVLRLRKIRSLQPELVLRVADWHREVITLAVGDVELTSIPELPGIYLFRDATGYLYIGEAENLARRMEQHFLGSHNAELAEQLLRPDRASFTLELHVFAADSPAKNVVMRRAYESELIRSRQPRFNLRP